MDLLQEELINFQKIEKLKKLEKQNTHICRIKGCGGAGWPPPTNNFRKT